MNRRTKLEMVVQIVDWEHRYKFGRLMSGQWMLFRVRELMKVSKAKIVDRWRDMFVLKQEG